VENHKKWQSLTVLYCETKTQGQKIVIALPWQNSDHNKHTFTDMQNMQDFISTQLW
jgi:hypothetical protein